MSIVERIILLFIFSAISGCSDNGNEKKKPESVIGDTTNAKWNEFCESANCDQFPLGYTTIDLSGRDLRTAFTKFADPHYSNDEYYYLPYFKNFFDRFKDFGHDDKTLTFVGRYNNSPGIAEFDNEKKAVRSYYPVNKISIQGNGQSQVLLEKYNLLKDWIKKTGFPTPTISIESTTELYRPTEPKKQNRSNEEAEETTHKREIKYKLINEHFYLTSYSELTDPIYSGGWYGNYCVRIRDGYRTSCAKPVNGKVALKRVVRLVSKGRIFFGHYVSVYCGHTCSITTIKDNHNNLPVINIHFNTDSFQAFPHIAVACNDSDPVLNCDTGIDAYEKIPAALKIIEKLVMKLREKPSG